MNRKILGTPDTIDKKVYKDPIEKKSSAVNYIS